MRLFAGARAAAGGIDAVDLVMPTGATIRDALDLVAEDHPGLRPVIPACSFLLDGFRTTPATAIGGGRTLDVLPPFSGG
ncbi:MAG: MoaD/ThiS family protein [Kineosporiaceae bacterium]